MTDPQVFISYSQVDGELVANITSCIDKLAEQGIEIKYFVAEKDIPWNKQIPIEVKKALNSCIAILIVVSEASLNSKWVPFEIGYVMGVNSMGSDKMILTILTESSLYGELPDYLRGYKWFNDIEKAAGFFKTDEWKQHVNKQRSLSNMTIKELRNKIKELDSEARMLEQIVYKDTEGY